jgi:hypothetical protein
VACAEKPKGNGIKEGFRGMDICVYAVVFWQVGFAIAMALLC